MGVVVCPDCGGLLLPEREDGELIGFVCEECEGFFDDVEEDAP